MIIFILLVFCLLNFNISQQIPNFNLSTIPSTNSTLTSCGVLNPSKQDDCTNSSDTFNYCCYLTSASSTGGFCQPISPTKFQVSMKTWTVNGTSYGIECGIEEGKMGTPCGVVDPKNYTDCTKYSTTSNSCCYYNNPSLAVNYCFWIGTYLPYSPIASVQCTPPSLSSNSSKYIDYGLTGMILFFLATL